MTAPTNWPSERNLLVLSPDLNDSVSWWRSWGPMQSVQRATPNLSLLGVGLERARIEWNLLAASSAVFINRPYTPDHVRLMERASINGLATWVDFDDYIFDIPGYNFSAPVYATQSTRGAAKDAAERAQFVSVSTPDLAQRLVDRHAPDANVQVIPNALPDFYPWNSLTRAPIVMWRGGASHLADIASVADDLASIQGCVFEFLGIDPYPVTSKLDPRRYMIERECSLDVFHARLFGSHAKVMIVPLLDNDFNRCKSNIAWLEGTLAGAAVLAPDFPEFRRPGCTTYKEGEFSDKLRSLVESDVSSLVAESRAYIDANLRLRHTTPARRAIVEALVLE